MSSPDPDSIAARFTDETGNFRFARWGRAPAPVAFGVEDGTLAVLRAALTATFDLAGMSLAETDPDLGANCMFFFLRDWRELAQIPDLDRLVPELPDLIPRLEGSAANQYRLFRFDADGAIRGAFAFLRMDAALSDMSVTALALSQAARIALLWSGRAFADRAPVVTLNGGHALHPEVAALIRAAYDPVLPAASHDPTLALRIAARLR